ncbi:hypothetical protein ABPG72_005761 [Tetrahymena utriculariae]
MKIHTSFFIIIILSLFDFFYITIAEQSGSLEYEHKQTYCQLYKQSIEFQQNNQIYLLSKEFNNFKLLGQDVEVDIKTRQNCFEELDKFHIDIDIAQEIISKQEGAIILFLQNNEGTQSHQVKQVLSFLITQNPMKSNAKYQSYLQSKLSVKELLDQYFYNQIDIAFSQKKFSISANKQIACRQTRNILNIFNHIHLNQQVFKQINIIDLTKKHAPVKIQRYLRNFNVVSSIKDEDHNNNNNNGQNDNSSSGNNNQNNNNNNGNNNNNNNNSSGNNGNSNQNSSNNGNAGNQQIICSQFCLKCTSSTICTQCEEQYFLNSNVCSQSLPIPGRFSPEQTQAAKESAQQANTAVLASSSAAQLLTSFSNPNSQMLMQILAIQKVYFLLLVNVPLPDILYNFILGLSGSSPVSQIQKINFLEEIESLYDQDKEITIGDQFQKQKISSSILISSGGTLFLFLFLLLILFIFFLTIQWNKTTNIAQKIFDKLASGLVVQFSQLLVLIISFGIFMQFKEFFSGSHINNLGLKIFFVILLLAVLASICYIQVKISLKNYFSSKIIYNSQQDLQKEIVKILEQDKDQNKLTLVKIITFLRERIQNDCLKEVTIQRIYMNIYLTHEVIIIPFIIVIFSQYFYLQIIFITITQILLAMITIYLKPFYQTIDNLFFIIDQLLWGFTFFIFTILSFMINNLESQIVQQTISSQHVQALDALSIMLIVLLILIQLLNPLVSFIKIGMDLYNIVKASLKKTKAVNVSRVEIINTSIQSMQKAFYN